MTPGEIVLTLWHWNGHSQRLTEQELGSTGRVVARVAAPRRLGVPHVVIPIIGMAYRCIFLLLVSEEPAYD